MNKKRLLPIVAALLLAGGVLAGRHFFAGGVGIAATDSDATATASRRYAVRVTPAARHSFERTVLLQGNVEAKRYAGIPARVFGTLDAVFVDEGDRVVKGETKLFQVDHVNLERVVLVAQQDLSVARCGLRESEANQERVAADFRKAVLDYERFKRLFEKDAVTEDALEQQQSRYEQILALKKHAAAVVDLAQERGRQAAIAVEIAQKNLSDSIVLAPIDGVVTERNQEPGEMAQPGGIVLRVEDLSTLEAVAFLPAQYFGTVRLAETEMEIHGPEGMLGAYPVSYKSPVIDKALRTFEVRCLLDDAAGALAPGAMVDVALAFERHEGLGVPRDAVLERAGQSVVFVVEEARARMVPVRAGAASKGWIEIDESALEAGAMVVSAGQYMLNDGASVNVQGEAGS